MGLCFIFSLLILVPLPLLTEDINLTLPLYLDKLKKNNLQKQINALNPSIQRAVYKEAKYTSGYLGSFSANYSQNETDAPRSLVNTGERVSFDFGWNYRVLESGTALSATLRNNFIKNQTPLPTTTSGETWLNTISLRVEQPLLSRGFIFRENERYLDANKFTAQLAESRFNQNYANLVYQAVFLYWQYRINLENFTFQKQSLADSRRILAFNKRKLQLEAISEVDVLENESQIINARIQLSQTEKTLQLLKENILFFMGVPLRNNGEITLVFEDELVVEKIDTTDEEVFNEALNNRNEFKDLAIQSESARNALVLGRLSFIPRLNFFMQYDIIGSGDTYGAAFSDMGFNLERNDLKWGLNFSFNTDIGAYRVPLERPSLLVTQAEKNYDLFLETLRKDVRQRVRELNNDYENYVQNRKNLALQRRKFRLSLTKYRRGEINFAIHINNKNTFNAAQIAYLNSKLAYLQSYLNLEVVQGTLLKRFNLEKIPISEDIPFK